MNPRTPKLASSLCSILLVDDVPHGLVARRTTLTDLGYLVVTAENGDQALALIRAASPVFDVLVTDYKMPGMDGLQLIRCVRQSHPALKIVLLSNGADILDINESNSGADVVLSKSAGELGQLTRTIKNLVSRKSGRKPAASQVKRLNIMVKSS